MKKFALVGCGHVAERHAENIQRIGKLVAVCDIVSERADAFAMQYIAKQYYSIEELLAKEDGVEIVVICTPTGYHAEHIIKSLQAGRHVVTENPLCLTTAAAWQIIETEKFCRRKIFVVKPALYNAVLQELKTILLQEGLGKICSFHLSCIQNLPDEYYTEWRGKIFPAGGTLYSQFKNYIDTLLWLFGDVCEVKGFKQNAVHQSSIEFEDTGTIALQMKNEVLGTFHWSLNGYKKNLEITLTILAERGMIKIGGEYLNEIEQLQTENSNHFSSVNKESNALHSKEHNSHYEFYNHLTKALNNEDALFADAYEGLKTVEVIEKIYKATADTGSDFTSSHS
jgi:predicted dehydrogenase